jgi:LemA protein
MPKWTKWLAITIVVVIIIFNIGSWVSGTYNALVTTNELVSNRFADIEAQYQRRMDLIPNIVETVKGSAGFEQSTLQQVVAARSAWAQAKSAGNVAGQFAAANAFDSSLSRLLVTIEAYPNIKSTQAFSDLTTALEGTENRIAVARRDYNEAVKNYNLKTKTFPSNLIAGMYDFEPKTFFEADSGAKKAPDVKFDFNPTTSPATK